MGDFLQQCANDAWEVIRGRKKIVGNRIIDNPIVEEENKEYGWIDRQGTFYPVEFGAHQALASSYVLKMIRKGDLSFVDAQMTDAGDWLIDKGWVLIHKPYQTLKITRCETTRLTNRQKEFLFDYLNERGLNTEAEMILNE